MSVSGIGGTPRNLAAASSSGAFQAVPTQEPEAPIVRGSAPSALGGAAPAAARPQDPRVEKLLHAYRHESAAELERTIAAAKKSDPTIFRTSVRELWKEIGFTPSKLKAHLMAMDANNDGQLTFGESYKTMHDMGFSATRAFMLSGLTAVALAPQTTDKFSFKVNVANADKTERPFFRTGFDTQEKLEERLDEVFAEDLDKDGFLTQKDLDRLVDKRTAKMESKLGARIIGYLNKSEWQGLLRMMDNNRINRDELRDFYQSSLFFSFLEPDNLAKKIVAYRGGIPG